MNATATLRTEDGRPFDPTLYEIKLRPLSEEDGGGWLATIPDLPGCTGDGEDELEAIVDVRSAALEWADACVHDGDPIPAPTRTDLIAAE